MRLNQRKIHINKFLAFCIPMLLFIQRIYSYRNIQWELVAGSRAFEAMGVTNYFTVGVSLTVLAIVFLLWVRLFSRYWYKYSTMFRFNTLALILVSTSWLLISFLQFGVKDTLYGSTNPIVYLTLLSIIIGYNNELWEYLSKYIPAVAVINILLAFYYYFKFISIHPGGLPGGNSPIIYFFISGFWLTAISVLVYKNKGKNFKVLYTMIISLLLLSVVLYSRGWFFQSILLLLLSTYYLKQKKGLIRLLKFALSIIVIGGLVYFLLYNYYSIYLEQFISKFGADTRSDQYIEIFKQTPIHQFLIGGGMGATYYFGIIGEYSYIDNQIIFTAFRYGIFMVLPYLYFFLSPLFNNRYKLKKNYEEIKIAKLIIIMWMLSLLGLSIYNGITIDFKNIFIPILVGRLMYLESGKDDEKIQNTIYK